MLGTLIFPHIFITWSSSTRPFSRPAAPLWWARGHVGSNPHCAFCTMASLKICGIVLHTRCQVCACPRSSQVNGGCLGSLFSSFFQYCCFLKWFIYLYNLHGKYIYIFLLQSPIYSFCLRMAEEACHGEHMEVGESSLLPWCGPLTETKPGSLGLGSKHFGHWGLSLTYSPSFPNFLILRYLIRWSWGRERCPALWTLTFIFSEWATTHWPPCFTQSWGSS